MQAGQIGASFTEKICVGAFDGAVIGGILGNSTFNFLDSVIRNDGILNQIQIILTVITLLFALSYSIIPYGRFCIKNSILVAIIGGFLGWISTLLGIGGGPINVAVLMLCCSMPIKEATVYSIVTILFSQFSKVLAVICSGIVWGFDLKTLLFIIPAAAIGGTMGARYSHVIKTRKVETVYRIAILVVISINAFNGYQILTDLS
ncbi:sulfite exporter TauE/SafE family protein [Pediococcus siamensis]|uniref:sulfite exporter TauE/SafE family protein n=1 Tax=Pediococcus siamensis TaxID=381829 RepID=UPI0039A38C66